MTKTLIPLEVQLRVRGFKDGAGGHAKNVLDYGDNDHYHQGYIDGRLAVQKYFEKALKEAKPV